MLKKKCEFVMNCFSENLIIKLNLKYKIVQNIYNYIEKLMTYR